MDKYVLRFKEGTGECFDMDYVGVNYSPKVNEEIVETLELRAHKHHKQPYLSTVRLEKIKDKRDEIIKNYSHVPGLTNGEGKDEEWLSWLSSIISFDESFDGIEITESKIDFPTDPNGVTITLTF